MISCQKLNKNFRIYQKEAGLKGSLRAFFSRKYIDKALITLTGNIGLLLVEKEKIKTVKRGRTVTPLDRAKNINLIDRKDLSKIISIESKIKDAMSRHELEQLAHTADAKILRATAISTLIRKYELTSRLFMKQLKEENIINLEHLSRNPRKNENENSIISLIKKGKLN